MWTRMDDQLDGAYAHRVEKKKGWKNSATREGTHRQHSFDKREIRAFGWFV